MALDRNKVLEAAQKYLAKGNYDKAIAEYQKLYDADPKDVRTLLKIGDLYTRKGALREAIEAYMGVATAYGQTGFAQKAVAVYKQVIKLQPGYIEPYQRLADNFEALGLTSDAIATYEQLAAIHMQAGELDKSLAVLGRMVELDASNLPVRIRFAEGLSKAGRTADAAREFEAGATQLKQQGRMDDYLKVAERLLYHRPEDTTLSLELARLYLERDDAKRALAKLQVCFKVSPKDTTVLELLARAFIKLDQKPKAVSVYREIAKIHLEQKRPEERAKVLKRILEIDPGDAEARQQLASYASPGRPLAEDFVVPPGAVVGGGQREPSRAAPMPQTVAPARPAPVIPMPGARPATVAPAPSPALAPPRTPAIAPPPPSAVESDEDDAEIILEAEPTEIAIEVDDEPVVPTRADARASMPPEVALEAQVARLLTECDVFARYGLKSKILEQLRRAVALAPRHVEARERLKDALIEAGRTDEAVEQLVALADIFHEERPQLEQIYLKQVLALDPDHSRAKRVVRPSIAPPGLTPAPAPIPGPPPTIEMAYDDEPASAEEAVLFVDDDDADDAPEMTSGAATQPPQAENASSMQEALASFEQTLDADEPELYAEPEPAADRTQITAIPEQGFFVERATSQAPVVEPAYEPELAYEPDGPDLDQPLSQTEFDAALVSAVAEPERASLPAGEVEEILDEADFYLAQGLIEEARGTINDALENHPNHPILLEKQQEVEDAALVIEAQNRAAVQAAAAAREDEDESFVLAAKLAEELEAPAPAAQATDAIDVDSVFAQFKKGIEQQIDASDSDTHYDLGIAYKEMGLFDDAIQAFTLAMQNPARECISATMIGLCRLEQGKIDAAIEQFERGLDAPGRTPREEMGLYFELGSAYEQKGDLESALEHFERVRARDPRFREVTTRIRSIEDRMIAEPEPEPQDDVDRAFDDLLADD